ncbi:hypothetical protein JCM8097_003884 [Rhodosporidiobolus ruineniae]
MLRLTPTRALSRLSRPVSRALSTLGSSTSILNTHDNPPRIRPVPHPTSPPLPPCCRPFFSAGPPPPSASVAPLVPFRTHPSTSPTTPTAHVFFHAPDSTWTYLVVDPSPSSRKCAVIDSVLDFDPLTNTVSTETADALLAFVEQEGLEVVRILETHAHADHLTAAYYLQQRLPNRPPVGISSGIRATQDYFAGVYELDEQARQELEDAFDELYEDGQEVEVGTLKGKVMQLPGHTSCSAAFQFGDYVFVGDTIFLPSLGTARADFPSGSAHSLYLSSQTLLSLPPSTRLFVGHNYPDRPEDNYCSATVAEQRELNRHLGQGVGEEEYVRMREERDRKLDEPRLLHQSLQVNIRGGRLPRGKDGKPYFRLPIKVKGEADGLL